MLAAGQSLDCNKSYNCSVGILLVILTLSMCTLNTLSYAGSGASFERNRVIKAGGAVAAEFAEDPLASL